VETIKDALKQVMYEAEVEGRSSVDIAAAFRAGRTIEDAARAHRQRQP
jgi:hypothetical protein